MKKLLFAIVFFYATSVIAQKNNVVVEGITPNLYLTHIVVPKESFYSIGRMYNQAPNAIATFNHTKLDKGLAVGQTLKIPLTSMNFEVAGTPPADEVLVPVYHIVSKNETLFRIGTNHTTPIENLRKWNNLSSDNIEIGNALIVGNLRVKKEQLNAFNNVQAPTISATVASNLNTETTLNTSTQAQEVVATAEEKKSPAFTPQTEVVKPKVETPVVANDPAPAKQEEPAVVKEQAKEIPVISEATVKQEVKSEVQKEAAASIETSTTVQANTSVGSLSASAEEGVFGATFTTDVADRTLMNKAGEAGTFKSTSGWQDKKYYVLMNEVAPGTIVKLSASTNKVVYAKVLGAMPDTKDSDSLILRMSNAAASYLGIIDPKFPVQVTYYQ